MVFRGWIFGKWLGSNNILNVEPSWLNPDGQIRGRETGRNIHPHMSPVSRHVIPCNSLGLCQQEGHHQTQALHLGPPEAWAKKLLFIKMYLVISNRKWNNMLSPFLILAFFSPLTQNIIVYIFLSFISSSWFQWCFSACQGQLNLNWITFHESCFFQSRIFWKFYSYVFIEKNAELLSSVGVGGVSCRFCSHLVLKTPITTTRLRQDQTNRWEKYKQRVGWL
jgi:hypothetical protein